MEAKGAAGWEASAAAWIARVDSGDSDRTLLLDPAMIELCGAVDGLDVLDIGCGEGRFARMLAERGARVTGIEPSEGLVRAAAARHPQGRYLRASAERLPFESNAFDLALLYLVLIDVPDFRRAVHEAARVLRPGGRLAVANILSFRSALGPWIRDAEGNRLYVPVDNYFEERAGHAAWCGISVTNFHRPAEAYFEAFLSAGLRLTAYREPKPTPEVLAIDPDYAAEMRVPNFNVWGWAK